MLLCALFLAQPFLAVTFPPIVDLPQQVAQIRLCLDAVTDPASPYAVQWLCPNSLDYAVLGACSALLPPLLVGKVAMVVPGCLWIVALHTLARRRGRSPGRSPTTTSSPATTASRR